MATSGDSPCRTRTAPNLAPHPPNQGVGCRGRWCCGGKEASLAVALCTCMTSLLLLMSSTGGVFRFLPWLFDCTSPVSYSKYRGFVARLRWAIHQPELPRDFARECKYLQSRLPTVTPIIASLAHGAVPTMPTLTTRNPIAKRSRRIQEMMEGSTVHDFPIFQIQRNAWPFVQLRTKYPGQLCPQIISGASMSRHRSVMTGARGSLLDILLRDQEARAAPKMGIRN